MEQVLGHQARLAGGPSLIDGSNALPDRRVLWSGFERVIGKTAGKPHLAGLGKRLCARQQDGRTAAQSRDLMGQRRARCRLELARPATPPAAVKPDDVANDELRVVIHRFEPRRRCFRWLNPLQDVYMWGGAVIHRSQRLA